MKNFRELSVLKLESLSSLKLKMKILANLRIALELDPYELETMKYCSTIIHGKTIQLKILTMFHSAKGNFDEIDMPP